MLSIETPTAPAPNPKPYSLVGACRLCGGNELIPTLDLGVQKLAGTFPRSLEENDALTEGPLALVRCGDPACGLVQLSANYSMTEQYGDNYGYRSGLNASMVRHLGDIYNRIGCFVDLPKGTIVIDIGSNDGTLLNNYSSDLTRVGFDPTAKKFSRFYDPDVIQVHDFFSANRYRTDIGTKKAKVITAISMLYDLPNPVAFIQDVAQCLAPGGVFYFEQSYVGAMQERLAYDTVCHEHLEYYGLKQIARLLAAADLEILNVTFNDTNGGSFAVTAGHRRLGAKTGFGGDGGELEAMLALEAQFLTDAAWGRFKGRVQRHRNDLWTEIHRLNTEGHCVAARGASTKGNVLLQYAGLTPRDVVAVAEVNPDKFGCLTPGTCIPIESEETVRVEYDPDVYLVLPWHFRDGFVIRRDAARNDDGYGPRPEQLLFPLPEVEVV